MSHVLWDNKIINRTWETGLKNEQGKAFFGIN